MVGSRTALIAALALGLFACDESIVIPGDTPGLMTIVAGVGDSIGTRVDSLARRTKLTDPTGIAFDEASGVLYVSDRGSTVTSGGITRRVARIFAIRSDGRINLLVDGRSCPGAHCPESVHSMAVGADGDVLMTDPVGNRIYRLRPGLPPDVIAGSGVAGDSPDGVMAAAADLDAPTGIAVDENGRILFSERGGHRVRSIRPDGSLGTVAGTGTPGDQGDGGPALQASLNAPAGLALSASGVLYIVDRLNARIRAVSLQTGTIAKAVGTFPGFGGDGGPAEGAQLDRPESVSVSPNGITLYVADTGNNRVRVVDLESGRIGTFAGNGSTAFEGSGRVAGDTPLDAPASVVTSSPGFLFIVDSGHSIVWRTRVLAQGQIR